MAFPFSSTTRRCALFIFILSSAVAAFLVLVLFPFQFSSTFPALLAGLVLFTILVFFAVAALPVGLFVCLVLFPPAGTLGTLFFVLCLFFLDAGFALAGTFFIPR